MDVAKLSPEQHVVFDQFKHAVADCKHPEWSDDYLLKWLIARDFDLAKSETMLRRSMEWRQINQVDGIVERWTPPEVLKKYYAIGMSGYDKIGCPVWICAFGRMDVIGILQSVSKREYIRYVTYFTEKSVKLLNQSNKITGKPVSYQTLIIDLDQFSVNQISYKPFMDVGMETIRMSEANYPEGVRRVFLINVPQVFTMVFAMIKPFLGQATLGKIRIFGHDSKAWKAALLEEIDADQLPAHYGGSMTDPDGNPMCLTKISMGGEVPKSYYLTKVKPKPGDHMKCELIAAGNRKRFEINIHPARSLLRWQFITEDGDIGFHIVFIKPSGDEMPMIPRDRIESHEMMEEGEISCIYSGTYIIEFDNSYSYFRSKRLWYFIDTIKPE